MYHPFTLGNDWNHHFVMDVMSNMALVDSEYLCLVPLES